VIPLKRTRHGNFKSMNWRQYGSKKLKKPKGSLGQDVQRFYYECCRSGCKARKQVDLAFGEPDIVVVTVPHNHPVRDLGKLCANCEHPGCSDLKCTMARNLAFHSRDTAHTLL